MAQTRRDFAKLIAVALTAPEFILAAPTAPVVPNDAPVIGELSALDKMTHRRLALTIRDTLYNQYLTWCEYNEGGLQDGLALKSVQEHLVRTMDYFKEVRAIHDYRLICDRSNNPRFGVDVPLPTVDCAWQPIVPVKHVFEMRLNISFKPGLVMEEGTPT